ncbi:MAG: hypothetical protein ACTHJ0_08105, partial [Flavipsychrobacter sp.]
MASQNQLAITGKVTSTQGAALPFLKIELRDSAGPYGLIEITYADDAGNFSFVPSLPVSSFITQGKIVPQYSVYLGSQLLDQQTIPYKDQQIVPLSVDDKLYQTAMNSEDGQNTVISGSLAMTQSGTPVTNVRIDLTDASRSYPYLISSTNTGNKGQFSFSLPNKLVSQILAQSNNFAYSIYVGKMLVATQVVPYTAGQQLKLGVEDVAYNDAVSQNNTPISANIAGQVTLNTSKAGAANVTVELADSQTTNLGVMGNVAADNAGNFTISLLDAASIWLTGQTVLPVYNVYYGSTLLSSKQMIFDGGSIALGVDDNAYNQASGGGGDTPPDFQTLVDQITDIRVQKANAFQSLNVEREALKIAQYNLAYASENGLDTTAINGAISTHTQNVNNLSASYSGILDNEQATLTQFFSYYDTQQYAVSQLGDKTPILFFPVRIETSFQSNSGSPQLWVRIFPDDIAVDTHEQLLSQSEIDQGEQYWQSVADAGSNDVAKTQAWDLLCRSFGYERAAWVTLQTKPASLTTTPLVFPSLTPKADSWTQQPVTRILPDAFVVMCYTSTDFSSPNFSAQTNSIPDEIKMGLDPNNNINFNQTGGDIVADPAADIDWLIHFDAAVAKGLGVKIPIDSASFTNGFTRIVVLGVKTSLNTTQSQQRLQDLINSHHYTDGFSLLAQGTSTNNTDTAYSGYSSVDFGNDTTYATEEEGDLFTPTTANRSKTDGQILCEALGIDYDPLYHIFHSNGYDIRDSMNINIALWATSWGYYLSDMMAPLVSSTTVDQLRDFFSDYVRSRGALPSIRSGLQPYGILPATVYSRMNWGTDPMAGLYSNVHNVTSILDTHFTQFASAIPNATGTLGSDSGGSSSSQTLFDILGQNAVSQDMVQRVGVGSGYIWNNLAYADREGQLTQQWLGMQTNAMNRINAESGLQLNPFPKISQLNFMPEHSSMTIPLVADATVDKNSTLPGIGNSEINYLQLIGMATFTELRDENYERYQINAQQLPDASLYKYTRQSLMLEYFNTACKLLNISDAQRYEPELVNVLGSDQKPPSNPESPFTLYTGNSRWSVMATPYNGYPTVADFIDSPQGLQMPEAANVVQTRNSILQLSQNTVGQLNLLTSELIDATAYRLDTWRLALVNQRLDDLRGIVDGSSSRNEGIIIGAYGWVENIKPQGTKTTVAPPTSNFTGTIYSDSGNEGYIHAPSINQAAAAAVLRNGYVTRANSSNSSVLSVNISSERVRAAEAILEGLRNGQPIGQLLGAQFEQRLRDEYIYDTAHSQFIDPFISNFRENFTLTNTVTAYDPSLGIENIKAANVLDGLKLANAFNTANDNISTFYTSNPALTSLPPINPSLPANMTNIADAITYELNWLVDILDATGDMATAEGVFQLVQGNQVRASAITDAISKGNYIPDIQLIDNPKTGTSVNQRFTLHLEPDNTTPPYWSSTHSARSKAEPYLNRWIGELLGDPAHIKCKVTNTATNTDSEILLSYLAIQPLDLVYMVNDELTDDASELALRIRSYQRTHDSLNSSTGLAINYSQYITSGGFSFEEILPLLKYLRSLIISCRALKTTDYITPTDAGGVSNQYDFTDYKQRATNARTDLGNAWSDLNTANSAFIDTTGIATIKAKLFVLSAYGFDQTVYEYIDTTSNDFNTLKSYANAVVAAAKARLDQYDALNISSLTIPPADADEFVSTCLQGLQAIFGRKFNALPLFTLRTQEHDILYNELTGGSTLGTLLNDQTGNPFVVDEWASGIAKIRKNVANYELTAIMASAINLDSFITN